MRRAKGTIHVFTFKDGVLSAIAHDLRIRLVEFTISLDADAVRGEFDLSTLFVDGPVRDGVVHPEEYDAGKRADVEMAMHDDVLHTDKHPTARFTGRATPEGDGFSISGILELAGHQAPLSFAVQKANDAYRARFELVPSRWQIEPYRALLGAIRLKDLVRIEIALTDA
jgi:polyisoprenoid-binding protein YceI